jgi:hypothetical protein
MEHHRGPDCEVQLGHVQRYEFRALRCGDDADKRQQLAFQQQQLWQLQLDAVQRASDGVLDSVQLLVVDFVGVIGKTSGEKLLLRWSAPQRLKPYLKAKAFIAAVNRCATKNQPRSPKIRLATRNHACELETKVSK